jgi:hypothetical protein
LNRYVNSKSPSIELCILAIITSKELKLADNVLEGEYYLEWQRMIDNNIFKERELTNTIGNGY